MNSHFDAQTAAISQIKLYGTILLFSQKNNNLHPALELAPLMEKITVCQITDLLETTKKNKKTASQLIFIQGEKNQQQVRQLKERAQVTYRATDNFGGIWVFNPIKI